MKRFDWIVAVAVSTSWLILLWVWIVDVGGEGLPVNLKRGVVVAAGLTTLVGLAVTARRAWQGRLGGSSRRTSRVLMLMTVMAIVVALIGVDWEVSGRYYRDEGIYYAAAQDLNQGQLLPESFIYGHLPYYLYAIALWIQSLFPHLAGWLCDLLYGTHKEVEVSWLMLRGLNSLLGALTVIPVFIIAFRIAGFLAGVLGAMLIVLSPIYSEIFRLIISDVPSAFFATVALMFVALLLDEETWPPYLLAGAAAGLAAASKYPAGVVVVAIIGIWIYWRVRKRNWSWSLVAAGVVSLATFLAVMPALWAHPGSVFVGQGKDMLFGLRQYGRGGWIGVMPGSNAAWYGRQLLQTFGLPALALGVSGWPWLDPSARRRFLQMLPFPLFFLLLLASMSMVVKRNLLPVMPSLAALLGAGVAGWIAGIEGRFLDASRRFAKAAVVVVIAGTALAVPLQSTVVQTLAFSRPSTREVADQWIQDHVPRGARFIQESYTPHLHFKKYPARKSRFAARIPIEEIRTSHFDYLLLTQNAYGRFMDPENWTQPHHEIYARRYEEMLRFELAQDFPPSALRRGPYVRLFKIDPVDLVYQTAKRFDFEPEPYLFPKEDAFLLLKEYFAPGRYEIRAEIQPPATEGRLELVTRDGRRVGELGLGGESALADLPWKAKYFIYVFLPKDARLRWLEFSRQAPAPE